MINDAGALELQIHAEDDLRLLCHGPRHFGTGKHLTGLAMLATLTAGWTFFGASHTGSTRNHHETLWTRLCLAWSYAITLTRSLLDSPIPDLQDLSRALELLELAILDPARTRAFAALAIYLSLGRP